MRREGRRRRARGVGGVRPGRAGAAAGRDRPRARDLGGGGRRRRGRGRPAREAQRLGAPLHVARRRRARPPLARGARGARRHGARRGGATCRSGAPSPTSTSGASGRSPCSGRSSSRRATTARCRGRSSARCDAVYFVSGDVAALRAARRSRVLVAAARELATLRRAEEEVDVLVGSGEDPGERFEPGELEPPPQHGRHDLGRARRLGPAGRPVPRRAAPGADRGRLRLRRLLRGRAHVCARRGPLDGRRRRRPAARCGAAVLTGRGAYAGQLGGGDFTL